MLSLHCIKLCFRVKMRNVIKSFEMESWQAKQVISLFFYNFCIFVLFSIPFKDRHLKKILSSLLTAIIFSWGNQLGKMSVICKNGAQTFGLSQLCWVWSSPAWEWVCSPVSRALTAAGFLQGASLLISGLFFPGVSKSCSWIEVLLQGELRGKVHVFGSIHCSYPTKELMKNNKKEEGEELILQEETDFFSTFVFSLYLLM